MVRHRLGWAALALVGLVAAGTATAGLNTGGGRKVFLVRMFTSEVPSNVTDIGAFTRIGVILPADSKVIRVQAYMDVEDHGKSVGRWRDCDWTSGRCEVGDARVTGLTRRDSETDVQVIADFWNDHESEPRYAKLRVMFMPIGNLRRKYEPKECWLRVQCGYAGWMDGDFGSLPAPGESLRIREPEPDDTIGTP